MGFSETITGVALLSEGGSLWALPKPHRHHHLFALAAFVGGTADPCTQGFVTSFGRFVNRKEAAQIVEISGQAMRLDSMRGRELYSEDVW